MTKYDIPVWKMCYEAAKELPKTFRPVDIVRKIKDRRPEVKENTIRAHVISLAPNHPSYRHYGMKRKLFYYLGDGNFRLLSEKDISIPPTLHKERIEKGTVFENLSNSAERLLNLRMYSQAIKEYGSIIEQLLKQLYQKYLPNLPIQYKERILNYERETKTPVSKFTIGQWIGLFRYADLFKYIAQDKKGKSGAFIFFTPATLDILNTLRNISTHPARNNENYVSKDSTLFVKSTITCILGELKE